MDATVHTADGLPAMPNAANAGAYRGGADRRLRVSKLVKQVDQASPKWMLRLASPLKSMRRGTLNELMVKLRRYRFEVILSGSSWQKAVPKSLAAYISHIGKPGRTTSCVQLTNDEERPRRWSRSLNRRLVWRRGRDLNSRTGYPVSSFQDWHVRPLRHPSIQTYSRSRDHVPTHRSILPMNHRGRYCLSLNLC